MEIQLQPTGHYVVRFTPRPAILNMVKAIPGRYFNPTSKAWVVPASSKPHLEQVCKRIVHFEPVKCDTCNGTGKFKCWWQPPEGCLSCSGTGWYKPESWVILARVRFGKYDCFHRPLNRVTERPEFSNPIIDGYIEHTRTQYSEFALFVLFLIYENGYLKRWYRETGNGWRLQWWLPRNWIRNIIHIIKKGMQVYIEGKIKTRQWDDKDGNKRYTTEIMADNLQMLSSGQQSTGSQTSAQSAPQSQQRTAAGTPAEIYDKPYVPAGGEDDLPF
ncbi:MAG: single-stranded DNA-binding protein [Mangrovibacterium sp.]